MLNHQATKKPALENESWFALFSRELITSLLGSLASWDQWARGSKTTLEVVIIDVGQS